jgi:O-antigen/teichoic acid export membrane protein
MLIAYLLGPASLAIYARSMALILHTNKLLFHFGRIFAPSASHLKAGNDIESLRTLVLSGVQNGTLIALPLMLVLGILGDSLLRIWMGPEFASLSVLPILAVGHLFSQSQIGTFYVLMGMNQHGKAGLATLTCSMLSLAGTYLLIKHFQLGLLGVSISTSLAVAIPYLTIIPLLAVKTLKIPLCVYLSAIIKKPILLCLPTALCLIAARQWAGPNDYQILVLGLGIGVPILIVMYWNWATPDTMKNKIMKHIRRHDRR